MSEAALRRLDWILSLLCGALVVWLLWRHMDTRWPVFRRQVNIELGLWSTRFLIAALAVSPIATLLRQPLCKRLRRPLGLSAAVLAAVHTGQFLVYTTAWPDRLEVVFQRPYQTVGLVALLLMLPPAFTSFNGAIRRLGPLTWRRVHWLVYPAAVLTVLHELMAWTDILGEVGLHAVLVAGLLAWRIPMVQRRLAPA